MIEHRVDSKLFTVILFISAIFMATMSAIFSVSGIAMLFAQSIYVVFMISSLELGKLVAASYLYRYWAQIAWYFKLVMSFWVLVLMIITSGGIFSYLTSYYQESAVDLDKINTEIKYLEDDVIRLNQEKQFYINEIAKINADYTLAKRKLIAQYQPRIDEIAVKLNAHSSRIGDLKLSMIQTNRDIGPLIYMAKLLNISTDDAVKWFIIVIIFVFDPLAISLVVAANMVTIVDRKNKDQINNSNNTITTETHHQIEPSPEVDKLYLEYLKKIKANKQNAPVEPKKNLKNDEKPIVPSLVNNVESNIISKNDEPNNLVMPIVESENVSNTVEQVDEEKKEPDIIKSQPIIVLTNKETPQEFYGETDKYTQGINTRTGGVRAGYTEDK